MLIPTIPTTLLATFTTERALDDGVAVTVTHFTKGYSVTLFDTDALASVGSTIYPDLDRAILAASDLIAAQ